MGVYQTRVQALLGRLQAARRWLLHSKPTCQARSERTHAHPVILGDVSLFCLSLFICALFSSNLIMGLMLLRSLVLSRPYISTSLAAASILLLFRIYPCLSVCLSIYPSIYLIYTCPYLAIYVISPFVCMSFYFHFHLSTAYPSIYRYIHPSLCVLVSIDARMSGAAWWDRV